MIKFGLYIALLFCCLYPSRAQAQNYENYWNYDISDGLPTNSLYHLLIDRKGRIWFGSDYGVICYDGIQFKTYTTKDGLLDNTVIRCYEDSLGRIWFQHVNLLPTYYSNGKIKKLNTNLSIFSVHPLGMLIEKTGGTMLISCQKNGDLGVLEINPNTFCKFHTQDYALLLAKKKNTIYLTDLTNKSDFTFRNKWKPYKISFVPAHAFLKLNLNLDLGAYTRSYLAFDIKLDTYLFHKYKLKKIYHIIKKKNKKIFGTSNGVFTFQLKNGLWKLESHQLKNTEIVSVGLDHQNNLWATSLNNGLFFISNQPIKTIQLENHQRCWFSKKYNGQIFNGGENVELSTITPSGLKRESCTKFKLSELTDIFIGQEYLVYPKNSRWNIFSKKMQSESKFKYENPSLAFTSIFKSTLINDRFYFYGALGLGFCDLNTPNKIIHEISSRIGRIKSLTEFDNQLFIGTQNGLFTKPIHSNKLSKFHSSDFQNTRINGFYSLGNQLLIATSSKGIWVYNSTKKTVTQAKIETFSENIKGIYPGQNGCFWVFNDIGLQKFQWKKNRWEIVFRYDLKTNLKLNEIVNLHELQDTVLISAYKAFHYIPIAKNQILPSLHFSLESFVVNDSNLTLKKENLLNPEQNNLTFNFSATNHSAHPIHFLYRINGGKWIENNSYSYTFSSLKSGDYLFEFKAKSPFYKNSDIKSIHFTIHEKWYQSIFVILGSILLFATLLIFIIRFRILKKSEQKRNILKTELLSLQSQMNPHFTFNSLNSIQSYLGSHDQRSAQIYLADFANLMRTILDQAKLHLISLDKEIDFLKSYLDLEKRRLEGQFDYEFQIDETITQENTGIPTLMLQPFVENAIWHGVAGLEYKGLITIRFKKVDSKIICEIADNGKGLEHSKKTNQAKPYHKSTGIANVNERIHLFEEIYHHKIEMNISSNYTKTQGTTVVVSFPNLIFNE